MDDPYAELARVKARVRELEAIAAATVPKPAPAPAVRSGSAVSPGAGGAVTPRARQGKPA